MGDRQTPADQGLHAVSGPLGPQAVLAGNRRSVPQHLGQSLRGGACSNARQISPACNASGCATFYATTSRQCEPICSKKTSSNFGNTTRQPGPPNFLMIGASKSCGRPPNR